MALTFATTQINLWQKSKRKCLTEEDCLKLNDDIVSINCLQYVTANSFPVPLPIKSSNVICLCS